MNMVIEHTQHLMSISILTSKPFKQPVLAVYMQELIKVKYVICR